MATTWFYNTCWEDPRLDRVALELGPDDNVLVITSAGCNALDYALTSPNEVHAVDMNPRQNALLELKVAGIKDLEFDDFFQMFGLGRLSGVQQVYEQKLRSRLSEFGQAYWDKRIKRFFDNKSRTFYYRGHIRRLCSHAEGVHRQGDPGAAADRRAARG